MAFLTSLLNALPGAAAQGLVWGIMAIGVYITFRVLDVADLTVDGSIATGAAVAVMLIRGGMNCWLALLPACSIRNAASPPFWPVFSPSWPCTPSTCGSWAARPTSL